MFSADGITKISEAIIELEKVTGGQMAVLTVPSLKGDALEDFSMRVAEKWKIGRKGKDNGIILLLVKDSREIRLEVGYGWEAFVNDARAGDIIREMAVFFRKGKFDDGVIFSVTKVLGFVSGKKYDKATVPGGNDNTQASGKTYNEWYFSTNEIIGIIGLFLLLFISIGVIWKFSGYGSYGGDDYGSGDSGGSCSAGGGFSGGGGDFGGGGASGHW